MSSVHLLPQEYLHTCGSAAFLTAMLFFWHTVVLNWLRLLYTLSRLQFFELKFPMPVICLQVVYVHYFQLQWQMAPPSWGLRLNKTTFYSHQNLLQLLKLKMKHMVTLLWLMPGFLAHQALPADVPQWNTVVVLGTRGCGSLWDMTWLSECCWGVPSYYWTVFVMLWNPILLFYF